MRVLREILGPACFHLRFCVYAGTFGMLLALVEWWVSEVKHILQFLLSVKSML
jgi:hypothetical protein